MTDEDQAPWPVSLADNHYQLSYKIIHDSPTVAETAALRRILEEISSRVRDHVWTGWSMFYPFSPPELEPKAVPEDEETGGGEILLETDLRRAQYFSTTLPDYWRVSPTGYAVLVRPYREDRIGLTPERVDEHHKPGEWLSPETPIRETAELVRHAYLFSQYFPSAQSVEFLCVWKGLKNRHLADFGHSDFLPHHRAHSNICRSEGRWPTSDLISNWPEVVAHLSCKVLNLFQFEHCGAGFVKRMEKVFRKLPADVG